MSHLFKNEYYLQLIVWHQLLNILHNFVFQDVLGTRYDVKCENHIQSFEKMPFEDSVKVRCSISFVSSLAKFVIP